MSCCRGDSTVPQNPSSKEESVPKTKVDPSTGSLLKKEIPRLNWSELVFNDDSLIGKGSYGFVVRAKRHETSKADFFPTENVLAVKVFARSFSDSSLKEKYTNNVRQQARFLFDVESRLPIKTCVTKVYGLVEGKLPSSLISVLRIEGVTHGIGIIMRYEGGGSLHSLIHTSSFRLSLVAKLRFLSGLSKSLAELHAAGIVHGNLTSYNVLISSDNPPYIRLSDFGLRTAGLFLDPEISSDLLSIYLAPELVTTEILAPRYKPTKQSDIYAFALLCWEVLAQDRPYQSNKNILVSEKKVCFTLKWHMM
jgi:serine/threonine protein kinase